MRGPIGVAPHSLEFAETVGQQVVRDGGTHSGMVLVHVHTLNLHRLTVEQQSAVGIKYHLANAHLHTLTVDHGLLLILHFDCEGV